MTEETKDYMPTAEEYYKQFERAVLKSLEMMITKHKHAQESIVVLASRQHVTPLLKAAATMAWEKAFGTPIPQQELRDMPGAIVKVLGGDGLGGSFEVYQKPYPSCDGEYVSYDFDTKRKTRFFYDMSPCADGIPAFERLRREGGHL